MWYCPAISAGISFFFFTDLVASLTLLYHLLHFIIKLFSSEVQYIHGAKELPSYELSLSENSCLSSKLYQCLYKKHQERKCGTVDANGESLSQFKKNKSSHTEHSSEAVSNFGMHL